jgi:hypothetical protein
MIHRDFVLIETPPGITTQAVRVITQMSTQERISAKAERPDLMFTVIGADEKDRLMGQDKPTIEAPVDKGISVHGMTLPIDLEKQVEEL